MIARNPLFSYIRHISLPNMHWAIMYARQTGHIFIHINVVIDTLIL